MKREIWLDFLRVTACFLVMTVHATEPFYLGAGAWTCGVSFGNADRPTLEAAGAHYVIDDFGQLTAVVDLIK